ncbi:MAG: hypothetical protein IPG76_00350 [Acidobacteria bacterium]|nr:hypothetical protein [Acidobacteriota bacterium]
MSFGLSSVSEWERLTDAILPLLKGIDGSPGRNYAMAPDVTPEGVTENLAPYDLNDDDIDYILQETGVQREYLKVWVISSRSARGCNGEIG